MADNPGLRQDKFDFERGFQHIHVNQATQVGCSWHEGASGESANNIAKWRATHASGAPQTWTKWPANSMESGESSKQVVHQLGRLHLLNPPIVWQSGEQLAQTWPELNVMRMPIVS